MISPETIAGIKALMAEASVFEDDLEESFVLGGGPGGQKTNKTSNVVRLSHEPSGLSVRCGETRSRETNRWLARRLLAETILEREHKRVSAERQRREKVRRQKRRRSRRQKQKMLDDKHAHSAIKALRRKVDLMPALAAASAALLCLFAPCAAAAADLQFLKELVEIPSSSVDYPQVNRATRAMKAYLEKRGLFCTVETDEQGREILFAATKPGKEQDYILSAHLDVVPASYEGQYTLKNDNGRLTGRGVGDDKGGSLAVAQTLSALAGKDVSVGCIFGADEELGGFTTTWMVEKMGYRPRRMVIVVDSSYGKIGYATKGQLMVRATLTGRGGHSSAPWRCEDLITELSAAVVKIKEEWYRRHPMATGPDHWSDVLTPTVIHSEGTALNRIPSEVWVNFNLRSVRPEAKDECIQLVREMTKGKVEVVRYSPPCVSDGSDPYVLRLKKAMEAEIKAPVPLERMPFATDARCFVSCKVPVVNVGHSHGDSHGATEWATASSIDSVTRYLTAFFLSEYRQGVATGASCAHVREAGLLTTFSCFISRRS